MAVGKRYKLLATKVNNDNLLALKAACDSVCATKSAKFDETVEIALKLGIDAKKSDQNVRGSAALPHGSGKTVRVAVFAKGEKAQEALDAGADIVGADDLAEKIKGGFFDFDTLVATPDMMIQVGKVGKLLGPKGLMPSPKSGTVTVDVKGIVKSIKAGRTEFRNDKAGIIHAPVGKVSFGSQKIYDNAVAVLSNINRLKPQNSKGFFIKGLAMSLTMGPSVRVDPTDIRSL